MYIKESGFPLSNTCNKTNSESVSVMSGLYMHAKSRDNQQHPKYHAGNLISDCLLRYFKSILEKAVVQDRQNQTQR